MVDSAVLGLWLDLVILRVFSSLEASVILGTESVVRSEYIKECGSSHLF